MPDRNVRDVVCEGCGDKILGTVELPKGATEERWRRALSGYLCEGCAPKVKRPLDPEERIEALEKRMEEMHGRPSRPDPDPGIT